MSEPLTHLAHVHELAAAFQGVARTLAPGGLFVFDFPTAGFNDRLDTWSVIDEAEDAVLLWRGAPSGDRAVQGDRHSPLFPTWSGRKALLVAVFAVESIYGIYQVELQSGGSIWKGAGRSGSRLVDESARYAE
ncbi:hypothetical protein [Streptomyces sp. 4N124]|uniref:hypothetical protein n=1 Tax=Streptomyces sp. 4N124 TaxID=3457420 RepID=UPI003FD56381